MSLIFISHASTDYNFGQQEIVGLLKALGFDTWTAPESIRSAELWKQSILRGLESSDWFVVIVSKAATRSRWVRKELNWAFKNLSGRIIPILTDSCAAGDLDERLTDIQRVDFGADRTLAIQKLVKLLVDAEYRGFQRYLNGKWICAYQPVYYSRDRLRLEDGRTEGTAVDAPSSSVYSDWHIQGVTITASPNGYLINTVPAKGTLQWCWNASLVGNVFLAGRWKSKRKSSQSFGYMSVQISRNGTYMFGHDYALVVEESKAHYGVLLFGKTKRALEKAWSAMKNARRGMPELTSRVGFLDLE